MTPRKHYVQAIEDLRVRIDAPDVASALRHLEAIVATLPPEEQYRMLVHFLTYAISRAEQPPTATLQRKEY